jgi:hypothetical protein
MPRPRVSLRDQEKAMELTRSYRTPTAKETAKLEKSRSMMESGIQGEKDVWSKISTTMAKSARDEMKAAEKMRESVPQEAREGEAYNYAGYKAGGLVKVRGQGAARTTKGCKIC